MSALPAQLKARLTTHPETAALLGGRIFPGLANTGVAKPYVVYHLISTDPHYAFGARASLVTRRVQVDAWAETFDGANELARRIGLALDRWGAEDQPVRDCRLDDERVAWEPVQQLHRARLDFLVDVWEA